MTVNYCWNFFINLTLAYTVVAVNFSSLILTYNLCEMSNVEMS